MHIAGLGVLIWPELKYASSAKTLTQPSSARSASFFSGRLLAAARAAPAAEQEKLDIAVPYQAI
jgi:hypothetical protein